MESVWPVTVAGWVTLVGVLLSIASILIGGGKILQKITNIQEDQAEMKDTQKECMTAAKTTEDSVDVLGDRFTVVEHTLWGPKGDNGLSLAMRELARAVRAIEDRNRTIDAQEERLRGAQAQGHENRLQRRRREDRILSGEEDA